MYYGNIKKYDIADGEGVRVTLFVSGCRTHCKGCFQKETWDFLFGKEFTDDTINEILEAMNHDYIDGLTLLGGEPFEEENQHDILKLLRRVKEVYPHKNIWSYTGYILEKDILNNGRKHTEYTDEILSLIDILVDGPFIEELKNISLAFRGSENQRVINLKETLKTGNTILYIK